MNRFRVLFGVMVVCWSATARAQEVAVDPLPADRAQEIARLVIDALPQVKEPPLKLTPDATKPIGLRAPQEVYVLGLPDKAFAERAISEAGKEPTPMGLLVLAQVMPVLPKKEGKEGRPASLDQLHVLTLQTPIGERKAVALYAAVKAAEAGKRTLLLYGKGKEPLFRIPLAAVTPPRTDRAEVVFEAKDATQQGGKLVASFFGKYQATLELVYQPQ